MYVDVNGDQTAYDVLGLPRDATPEQIRAAYRRLAASHHPDMGGDEERFKQITQAHTLLKDPRAKAQYDAELDFTSQLDQAEVADFLLHEDAPSWEKADLGANDPFWFLAADRPPGDPRTWSSPQGASTTAKPSQSLLAAGMILLALLVIVGAYVLLG